MQSSGQPLEIAMFTYMPEVNHNAARPSESHISLYIWRIA